MNAAAPGTPGYIEVDRNGGVPRVRFTPPQEWFTLRELVQFAKYLVTVAEENEPSPEVEAIAGILDTCSLTGQDRWATARAVLTWMQDRTATETDSEPLWAAAERARAEGRLKPLPRMPSVRPESDYEMDPPETMP